MLEQNVESELCVSGVVLGTARAPGLPVASQRLRVDRKQYEDVVIEQRRYDGPSLRFEADGDGTTFEALVQLLAALRTALDIPKKPGNLFTIPRAFRL